MMSTLLALMRTSNVAYVSLNSVDFCPFVLTVTVPSVYCTMHMR